MHLLIGIDEGICLASPFSVLRSPSTSRGWPKGPSPGVPLSYEVLSPSGLRFAKVALHKTDPLRVVLGQVQSHEKSQGRIFIIVTHETRCVPLAIPVAVLSSTPPPQPSAKLGMAQYTLG